MTIKEHERIVLTHDLPEERLEAGDVGTVIHVHAEGAGYEVEFMTLSGNTIAIATLLPSHVRPVGPGDVAHVRELHAV